MQSEAVKNAVEWATGYAEQMDSGAKSLRKNNFNTQAEILEVNASNLRNLIAAAQSPAAITQAVEVVTVEELRIVFSRCPEGNISPTQARDTIQNVIDEIIDSYPNGIRIIKPEKG